MVGVVSDATLSASIREEPSDDDGIATLRPSRQPRILDKPSFPHFPIVATLKPRPTGTCNRMHLDQRIRTFSTKTPTLARDTYVAPGSVLVGDVTLGEHSSVWFQAVLRADLHSITIGACSNIQDGAVIHVADAYGTRVGERVTVGHCAVLHACTIGDEVLVGMNAVVLDGAEVGARSIIGANALVTSGTRIPEGSLFLGSPGKVVRTLSIEEQAGLASWAERYVVLAEAYRKGLPSIILPPVAPIPVA